MDNHKGSLTRSFEPDPSRVSSLACTLKTFCSLSSFNSSRIHLDAARADQETLFLVFFCLWRPEQPWFRPLAAG